MNCGNLPGTGGPAGWLLLAALASLTIGLLIYRRHGRHADAVILTLLLMIGAGIAVVAPSPGQAADNDCADPEVSAVPANPGVAVDQALVITQTSVIDDLGPTNPPVAIRGRVTNPSLDSTYVTSVTVSIKSVTKAPGAAAGSCSAADYEIADPRMPVDLPLAARSDVPFAGASIRFLSTTANQDACKNATINFRYVSDSR